MLHMFWGERIFLLECLVCFHVKKYSWLRNSVLKPDPHGERERALVHTDAATAFVI